LFIKYKFKIKEAKITAKLIKNLKSHLCTTSSRIPNLISPTIKITVAAVKIFPLEFFA
jgi:hypothetical protein